MRGGSGFDFDADAACDEVASSSFALTAIDEDDACADAADTGGGAKLDGRSHETGASSTPCTSREHQGTLNSLLISLWEITKKSFT